MKEQEILNKARKLFLDYGLRSITMDDLAKELGMSKRTLYKYFKDKADLIRRISLDEVERNIENMKKAAKDAENSIDKMMKINVYLIDIKEKTPKNVKYDLKKYYPEILAEMRKNIEEKMFQEIYDNLKQGQEEGFVRKDLNIEIIAWLQVGRSSAFEAVYDRIRHLGYAALLNEIFDYHIHAVATKKGLDYYKSYKKRQK